MLACLHRGGWQGVLLCLGLVLPGVCNPAWAQVPDPFQPEPETGPDRPEEFRIDDGVLAGAFDTSMTDGEASWWDGLTLRVSQLVSAQVNRHRVDLGALGSLPRRADFENNRLQINARYQRSLAPGWLLQASGWYRLYWNQDYMVNTSSRPVETEGQLNDLFIQFSRGAHSLKLGNQTLVWGETVGNSVLDVINHTEFRDFMIIDIEDARLNQPMLIWDYFADGNHSVSSFITLYPRFNPAPVRGSPLFFDPGFHLPDYDRDGKVLLEAGVQWKKSIPGSDLAIMAAYLYENQLRYDPPRAGEEDARPAINDFLLLGFSANRAIGRLLLGFDLAFSHNLLVNSFAFPGSSNLTAPLPRRTDQLGSSFGFEWAVSNRQNLSLGIQALKLLNPNQGLSVDQKPIRDGLFGNWLVRYSNSLRNEDLTLSSTLQGDLAGDSLFLALGLDLRLNDNWAINGQLISIHSSLPSPLAVFDEDLRLSTTLSYSF